MKKTLLSLVVIATAFWSQSQVTFSGVSPASVVGNYNFGVQAGEGIWPGEVDDATWNVVAPDFNINGTFIQDTLMLVEDGTPGMNPQGNPISQEGCSTLTNDLSGKIAVVYRNTCEFGTKVLNAQNAGAIACIIVNREDAIIGMLGGADGVNVTIPCIAISSVDGATLINEMVSGPVVVFLGNKLGVFANDMGSYAEDMLIAPFATYQESQINGFDLGIQLYNYGSVTQNAATVNAQITGPAGPVYDQTVALPTMATADTAFVFNGNTLEFPRFDLGAGNYPVGDYTLTYTITPDASDNDPGDNVFVYNFNVNATMISLAGNDGTSPLSNSYPKNSTTQYKSCMFYVDTNASVLTVEGIHFTAYSSDLTTVPLAGEEITITIEEWNDVWADITDPNIFSGLDSLNVLVFEQYYPATDAENGVSQYIPLTSPLPLVNSQRYLVCLETFNSEIAFGYDNQDYSANQAISLMPVSPLQIDGSTGQWYSGWNGTSASSIGLQVGYTGLSEISSEIKGKAYPNPAGDNLMISVEAEGAAVLTVTDLSGKVVLAKDVNLVNGLSAVNTSTLEAGMYIFNVTLENGSRSIFNVVKK
ncbi:MAG: T9SS type A sorting domain-containing protein [Fluviicola sp.]|nr:T9SS type A sorting domain-containing protein [Fluviicola sp.]